MPVNMASDWYSVGVMLFQALTGKLPPRTPLQNVLGTAREPKHLDSQVPQDLNELCRRLLDSVPERRPDGRAILAALKDEPLTYVAEATSRQNSRADHFVGRNEQLTEMNSAFANTQEGRLTVLLIEGPSGIGKSTLVRRFLGSVSKNCPTAVVFSGRCYEFETVPYKGLDAVLDELCHYLQKIPDAQVQALLPRDAFLLPKLFPSWAV